MAEFTAAEFPDTAGAASDAEEAEEADAAEVLSLNYETWGYPDSPPAVLIHGLGGDLREWHAVANILAERYWVIAPDLRGHGLSAAGDDPREYSLDALTEDLIDLMDFLQIELAAVTGAGLGAAIALNLALTAPARVPALVLADLDLDSDSAAGTSATGAEETGVVARLGPAGLGARLSKEVRDPFLASGLRSRYQRLSREGYLGGAAAQREAAARFGGPIGSGGTRPYVTPSMPVLLCVSGEGSSTAATTFATDFAEAAIDGRLIAFDRCLPPLAMHCPEDFADSMMGFFAAIEEAHRANLPH